MARLKHALSALARLVRANSRYLVALLLCESVIAHFFLAAYPKIIDTYPDELLYYGLARSLYRGEGLTVRGLPQHFQKLAYPLLLVPFFVIDEPLVRLYALGAFNCALMLSALIPIWLVGRRLRLPRHHRYLLLLLAAIWPELLLSATLMSESLYWPLFWWWLYWWLGSLQPTRHPYLRAVLGGVLLYWGYFTKEIFLAVLLAYVVAELAGPLADWWRGRPQRYPRSRLVTVGVSLVTFALIHLSVKLICFRGWGNSYHQASLDAILSVYNFAYFIYASLYYLVALATSVLLVPIVYPLVHSRSLPRVYRRLLVFAGAFTLILAVTVAYTISIREDLGSVTPRLHLRYFAPGLVLWWLVFLGALDHVRPLARQRQTIWWLAVAVAIVVSGSVFRGSELGSLVDGYTLAWYDHLIDTFPSLTPPAGQTLVFPLGRLTAGGLVALAVGGFSLGLAWRRPRVALGWLLAIYLPLLLVSNALAYNLLRTYCAIDPDTLAEVRSLQDYLLAVRTPETVIVHFTNGERLSLANGQLDTYLDRLTDIIHLSDAALVALPGQTLLAVAALDWSDNALEGASYPARDHIDFIITDYSTRLEGRRLAGCQPVFVGEHFQACRLTIPDTLQLIDAPEATTSSDLF